MPADLYPSHSVISVTFLIGWSADCGCAGADPDTEAAQGAAALYLGAAGLPYKEQAALLFCQYSLSALITPR